MERKQTEIKKIIVIVGPTSSGKTSLGLQLSLERGGDIISADSRQVYSGLDVGTGKLPIKQPWNIVKGNGFWEMQGKKVWGYDLVNISQAYSSYDWAKFALMQARILLKDQDVIWLVGGTGFYIDTFTGRLRPSFSPPNEELRHRLNQLSLHELQAKLQEVDPSTYQTIDTQNPVRLVRALERKINVATAESLDYLDQVEFLFIGLTAPREFLYRRVDLWLETVWENGLIEEVTQMLDAGFALSPILQGLVYKQVISYLNHEISQEEAIQKAKFDLHAYIRRQQTYFKKMPNINWLDISEANFLEKVYNLLNRS